jgi:hypothetical protein
MAMDRKFWLLVGREFEKNSVKYLYLVSNVRERKKIPYAQFWNFSKGNAVLNAEPSGDSLRGIGIDLNMLPRYKRVKGGVAQCGGLSEAIVVRQAQPQIRAYVEKVSAAEKQKQLSQSRLSASTGAEPNHTTVTVVGAGAAGICKLDRPCSQGTFTKEPMQREGGMESAATSGTLAVLFPDEEVTYFSGQQ